VAELKEIPVGAIYVVKNVRKSFDPEKLKELAESIKANGIIQPLLVREKAGRFELVAGERRYRASKLAKLSTVPCVVKKLTDEQALEAQLVENTHREDMNALDEAFGVKGLYDALRKRNFTQVEVAERLGRTDFYVSMMCSLTTLPPRALDMLRSGFFSKSVAYEITKVKDPHERSLVVAEMAPGEGIGDTRPPTIEQTKALIRRLTGDGTVAGAAKTRAPGEAGLQNYQRFWKYWLLEMSGAEFLQFKHICRGRYQDGVMSEAVELVMRQRPAPTQAGARVVKGNGARA
jgi:ParB/RepB/Spo0J family partition protein